MHWGGGSGGAFSGVGARGGSGFAVGLLREAAIHFYCLFDGSCF